MTDRNDRLRQAIDAIEDGDSWLDWEELEAIAADALREVQAHRTSDKNLGGTHYTVFITGAALDAKLAKLAELLEAGADD